MNISICNIYDAMCESTIKQLVTYNLMFIYWLHVLCSIVAMVKGFI
jgi:hypothetical protein